LPVKTIGRRVARSNQPSCTRPQELIRTALDLELQEGSVVADWVAETPCVFLSGLCRAERTIAERLMRLASGTLP
jgi:exodeoxyribonuclease V alpha subunit